MRRLERLLRGAPRGDTVAQGQGQLSEVSMGYIFSAFGWAYLLMHYCHWEPLVLKLRAR